MKDAGLCSVCSAPRGDEFVDIELKGVRDGLCFNCLLWYCFLAHEAECRKYNIGSPVIWDVILKLDAIQNCRLFLCKEGAA